jgi:hypothetical protein
MYINTSGNIGIGTTSPSEKLSIEGGSITLNNDNAAANYYLYINKKTGQDGGIILRRDASTNDFQIVNRNSTGDLDFYAYGAASTVVSILRSNGNVGIGTTSPSYKLTVNGILGFESASIDSPFADRDSVYHRIYEPAGNIAMYLGNATDPGNYYDNTTHNFRSRLATTNYMIINSSGYVGIGTTSPQKRLEAISDSNDFVSVGVNQIASGSWTGIHFGYREANNLYRKSAIVFERTDLTSTDAQGKIHILNGIQGSSANATLSDAKLTIAENGDVGIGQRSPTAKIHISSPNGSSGTLFQRWDYAGNPGVYELQLKQTVTSGVVRYNFSMINANTSYNDVLVLDRGKVGIGLTDPAVKLHIDASGAAYLRGGDDHEWWDINVANTAGLYGVQNSAVGALKLGSGGATIFGTSGRLGVETTAPAAVLQVAASISDTGSQTARICTNYSLNSVVDALHIDHGSSGAFTEGVAISLGYKSATYGSYTSRIINYLNTGVTQATKLQLQTQANGGTTWNTGILIDTVGNVGINTTTPSYKLDVAGNIATDYTINDSSTPYRLVKPRGGVYSTTTSTVTGAIKITYPVGYTNTMHHVKARVYEYITNRSFTIHFGGYNYQPDGSSWYNTFAYVEGDAATNINPTVRFGYDGSKMVVYIGELASSWTYPQVFIDEVGLGYSGVSSTWATEAWAIGFEASAFASVTATISNTKSHVFARNGSDAYYSTGNVGINTTSPAQKLDIQGDGVRLRLSTASSPATYYFDIESKYDSADTINFYGTAGNNLLKYIYNTNALNLQPAGGSVGIGTTTPGEKLHVVGGNIKVNNGYAAYFGDSANNNGGRIYVASTTNDFYINQANNSPLYFATNNAIKATILGNGDFGINDTSPSYKLDVDGTIRATGDVIAFSDARVKENVQTIENALDKVVSLRGVTYTRNDSEDKSEKVGVIAQEVLEILPEVVQQDDKGNYSVAYGNIVGVLIEAIKELKAEIDILKNK